MLMPGKMTRATGFSKWADDGMKRLAVRERVEAVRAAGEVDEFIASGHLIFPSKRDQAAVILLK